MVLILDTFVRLMNQITAYNFLNPRQIAIQHFNTYRKIGPHMDEKYFKFQEKYKIQTSQISSQKYHYWIRSLCFVQLSSERKWPKLYRPLYVYQFRYFTNVFMDIYFGDTLFNIHLSIKERRITKTLASTGYQIHKVTDKLDICFASSYNTNYPLRTTQAGGRIRLDASIKSDIFRGSLIRRSHCCHFYCFKV